MADQTDDDNNWKPIAALMLGLCGVSIIWALLIGFGFWTTGAVFIAYAPGTTTTTTTGFETAVRVGADFSGVLGGAPPAEGEATTVWATVVRILSYTWQSALTLCAGGWAVAERLLRRKGIRRLQEKIIALETVLDPDRTSSDLLQDGRSPSILSLIRVKGKGVRDEKQGEGK